MKNQEILQEELIKLHREFPNNMDFGKKVRQLVWQILEKKGKETEDVTSQTNILGKLKNGI